MGSYSQLAAAYGSYGVLAQSFTEFEASEEIPLGVFVITDIDIEDSGNGTTMVITGVDRSLRISKAEWIDPYQIPANTELAAAISGVLTNRWPSVETDFYNTGVLLPATVLGLQSGSSGKDPWANVQQMASSNGFDLYFDATGRAVLVPVSDPSTATPLETYEENEEAMILSVKRRLSTDNTFNGVVATGEGSSVKPPVRAVAFDDDPASPTYRYGLFGERPKFISSSLVTSASAAASFAAAELAKIKGAEENVDWVQVCDPSLDAGDVVKVRNTGTRLDKVLVLDKVTIPLAPSGTMSATARTVRVLVEGES